MNDAKLCQRPGCTRPAGTLVWQGLIKPRLFCRECEEQLRSRVQEQIDSAQQGRLAL